MRGTDVPAREPYADGGTALPRFSVVVESYTVTLRREVIGPVAEGIRIISHFTGGQVDGPQLRGKFRPGGADFVILRRDGIAVLDCHGHRDSRWRPDLRGRIRSGLWSRGRLRQGLESGQIGRRSASPNPPSRGSPSLHGPSRLPLGKPAPVCSHWRIRPRSKRDAR